MIHADKMVSVSVARNDRPMVYIDDPRAPRGWTRYLAPSVKCWGKTGKASDVKEIKITRAMRRKYK